MLDLADFDLSLIQAAIRGQQLPEHEYSGVEERLRTAIKVWLPQDLAQYESCLQEEEFSFPEAHGFLDLVLASGNTCIITDWKTTQGWDSPGWALKKKLDPQSSWYLGPGARHLQDKYSYATQYLEYRCVTAEGEFKTFQVAPSSLHEARVQGQHEVLARTFEAMQAHTGPWLQRLPEACFYGSKSGAPTCRFYGDCTTGSEPRLVRIQNADWTPRSKSAYKQFSLCPELYRRTRLLGDSSEEMGIEAKIGIAFHLGVAEVWRQAFLMKGK